MVEDKSNLVAGLAALVDPGRTLTDADSLQHYGTDWTKKFQPAPLAVVLPKTPEQVQAVVKYANEHNLKLVPSGGRTGLSAAAVAANGEVVVAFDLMNQILEFNPVDRTVRCQAGVVTEQLQQCAEDNGLYYPVDFASAGSSQLGGNISTNAGGIKVIRYGMTRDWVLGLKVVTGAGEMLDLNKGLIKNATGYDFRHLFIGAEGTLGFIVEATIQLTRAPKDLTVMVLGVPQFQALMAVLETFQRELDLTAFEFFSHKAVELVTAHQNLNPPFAEATPYYALLEFDATSEAITEQATELFERCVEQGHVVDAVISQSTAQAQALWGLREGISETIAPFTPYKNDISVTVSKVPEFLQAIDEIVAQRYPEFEIVWFGHIGDGNLHLNILKPDTMDKAEFFSCCEAVNQEVFATVQRFNGSVSAEHGVGMTKKPYLDFSRSAVEIDCMRGIKQVFDPNGIMNPGKVFD